MELENEINKGMVTMSKRLEGFMIGREIAFQTVSALEKRGRKSNELVRKQSIGCAYERATKVGFNTYYKPLKHRISAFEYPLKYEKTMMKG